MWQTAPLWLRSLFYYTLFGLLVYGAFPALCLWLGLRLGLPEWVPWPWNLLGVAPAILGMAGATWSLAVFFRRGHGTAVPYDPPHRLVTTGPYAYCRNPMVGSQAIAMLGWALVLRAWAMVPLVLVAWGVFDRYHRGVEEGHLVRRFGPQYERYRRRVPMWIPRRPRPQG
jgi:protein-S-isoprenylcysteine O-methyltransferase Ste14